MGVGPNKLLVVTGLILNWHDYHWKLLFCNHEFYTNPVMTVIVTIKELEIAEGINTVCFTYYCTLDDVLNENSPRDN